jgi:hypothetical protein
VTKRKIDKNQMKKNKRKRTSYIKNTSNTLKEKTKKYKKYKNKLNYVIKVAKKYYEEQLIKYKHDTKVL